MMVKQRSEFDCVLACLAMASEKDYDSIFDEDFRQRIEISRTCSGDNLDEAIARAGFIKSETVKCVYVLNTNIHIIRQMLWKRKAMLQVDSLNYESGQHMVYWDGNELHDPSNKLSYTWLTHLHPVYVWIFEELK